MSVVRIPHTPTQLIRIARGLDRFRAWCETEGLGWPSLEEQFAAREAVALESEHADASD